MCIFSDAKKEFYFKNKKIQLPEFSSQQSVVRVSTQFRAYLFERVLFSALNRVLLIN